jgi:sporulation protein YlmC with PRC-barrel domain
MIQIRNNSLSDEVSPDTESKREDKVFKGQTTGRLLLWSSTSFLLAAGLTAPAASFAQQNDPNAATLQSSLTAPLNNLNDAQKTYAGVKGMVSELPASGLATREKAAQALAQIRSGVLQVRNSDKVPQDLMHNTLTAIDEAQTALKTDNAQTIAWSLQTVSQEAQAVEAKLAGQNPPQTASAEHPTPGGGGTQAPQQASTAKAPEQQQARVAEAEQKTGVTPQTQQAPNTNTTTQASGPAKQATPEQPPQQTAQAKQPATQPSTANQPAAPQNAVASMKGDDIVGKYLYDKNGDNVAKIQDVKTSPDGKIQAVEIDVGGFLGIGSRRIAVPVDSLQVKGDRIESTSMTSDQIQNLPHESK